MKLVKWLVVLVVVAGVGGTIGTFVLNDDVEWVQMHTASATTSLTADRPECPVTWSGTTIPILSPRKGVSGLAAAASFVVPPTGLSVPGPITDIPEFHDCQKFIRAGGAAYDSLFAIFAAYNLDSVMTALAFDAVTWSSSNASVATVSASGVVTAVAVGNAIIKATATAEASRVIALSATVVGGAAIPGFDTTVKVMAGAPPLPALHVGETANLQAVLGPKTTATTAAAEIYTFGEGYDRLGIGQNFSCLYVYFDSNNRLVGKMVKFGAIGTEPDACVQEHDPNQDYGERQTMLDVIRTPAVDKSAHPAAARWDFDTKNQQYYIGLKCGLGWCEVGARHFRASSALTTSEATSAGEAVVMQGKGWYDQQELAWIASGQMTPSGLIGTVIPDPELERYKFADFKKKFRTVAYVGLGPKAGATVDPRALKYYKDKFNYDPVTATGTLDKLNKISICYGSRRHCDVPEPEFGVKCGNGQDVWGFWPSHLWVKVEAAGGGRALYRCGVRRDHSGMPGVKPDMIAATTRWRWLANDETTWDYCSASGCCEMGGDGVSPGWR